MLILHSIYKPLKKFAEVAGFNLVVTKRTNGQAGYEPVLPSADYAPWLSDSSFNEIYEIIKDHTLVDKYRLYELWQLVEETAKLNGSLIEIGIWRGEAAL